MQTQAPHLPDVGLLDTPRAVPAAAAGSPHRNPRRRLHVALRNTIHLVIARDAFAMSPLFTYLARRGCMREARGAARPRDRLQTPRTVGWNVSEVFIVGPYWLQLIYLRSACRCRSSASRSSRPKHGYGNV
jgi:hypothetical protein